MKFIFFFKIFLFFFSSSYYLSAEEINSYDIPEQLLINIGKEVYLDDSIESINKQYQNSAFAKYLQ